MSVFSFIAARGVDGIHRAIVHQNIRFTVFVVGGLAKAKKLAGKWPQNTAFLPWGLAGIRAMQASMTC